jgi:hypothetical protein
VKPLRSAVDRQASGYQTNYAAMQSAVAQLHAELKRSTEGGGDSAAIGFRESCVGHYAVQAASLQHGFNVQADGGLPQGRGKVFE